MGKFRGQINVSDFARLAQFIREEGYVYWASNYAVPASDMSTTYTLVRTKSGVKTITSYGNSGPARLWVIEQMIDKLIDNSDLVPVKSVKAGERVVVQ